VIIVVARIPEPDFVLVDKLIVNAHQRDIQPVICINKSDITDEEYTVGIKKDYGGVTDVITVSAELGEIEPLKDLFEDNIIALAGQSAVGKTSLLNAIFNEEKQAVGALSKKVNRGRHTTRHNEIFDYGDTLIIDTGGFSEFQLELCDPNTISEYYYEYNDFARKCRYRGCSHVAEEECGVKAGVVSGELSGNRYDRYVAIYNEMSEKWRRRYD